MATLRSRLSFATADYSPVTLRLLTLTLMLWSYVMYRIVRGGEATVHGQYRLDQTRAPAQPRQYILYIASLAEWLACWTQAQSRRCRVTVLGKLFTPIVPSVHQAAKLVAALLRVSGVTAGLAESNGSLPPGL